MIGIKGLIRLFLESWSAFQISYQHCRVSNQLCRIPIRFAGKTIGFPEFPIDSAAMRMGFATVPSPQCAVPDLLSRHGESST